MLIQVWDLQKIDEYPWPSGKLSILTCGWTRPKVRSTLRVFSRKNPPSYSSQTSSSSSIFLKIVDDLVAVNCWGCLVVCTMVVRMYVYVPIRWRFPTYSLVSTSITMMMSWRRLLLMMILPLVSCFSSYAGMCVALAFLKRLQSIVWSPWTMQIGLTLENSFCCYCSCCHAITTSTTSTSIS